MGTKRLSAWVAAVAIGMLVLSCRGGGDADESGGAGGAAQAGAGGGAGTAGAAPGGAGGAGGSSGESGTGGIGGTAGSSGAGGTGGVGGIAGASGAGGTHDAGAAGAPPATPVSIEVVPQGATVEIAATRGLSAITTWSDGTKTCSNEDVTWSSSDPQTITVSNEPGAKGLLAVLSGGAVEIMATDQIVTGSALATGAYVDFAQIVVTPPSATIPAGFTQALTATAILTNATSVDFTKYCTWTSDAPSVVAVDPDGMSTGLSVGQATIAASWNGLAGTPMSITVTGALLVSIDVSPDSLFLPPGWTQRYVAIGTFTDGSTRDISRDVVWSTSDPSRIEVLSGGAPGRARVLDAADSAVGIEIVASRGGVVGAATVDIAGDSTLEYIEVSLAASTAMWAGSTVQASATGYWHDPGGPFAWDITDQVVWTSQAPVIATVSGDPGSQGLVTTRGYGAATIGASFGSVSSDDTSHGGGPDPQLEVTACPP